MGQSQKKVFGCTYQKKGLGGGEKESSARPQFFCQKTLFVKKNFMLSHLFFSTICLLHAYYWNLIPYKIPCPSVGRADINLPIWELNKYRVFIKYCVFFPNNSQSLPPLPLASTRLLLVVPKRPANRSDTEHLHWVESFEGLLQWYVGEGRVAVNCEKTQFFLNTLYVIWSETSLWPLMTVCHVGWSVSGLS